MLSSPLDQLRSHVVKTLGPIAQEWDETTDGVRLPFTIARVPGSPVQDATTWVTLGLSDCHRHFPSGKPTRQELVFACYANEDLSNVEGLIAAVALEGVNEERALGRGRVLGPAGPILKGTDMEALYASLPAYFSTAFGDCSTTAGKVHFMWLVPVYRSEAEFVLRAGWELFEGLLEKQDPDLLDLSRGELRIPAFTVVK